MKNFLCIFLILVSLISSSVADDKYFDKDGNLIVYTHYSPPWSDKGCIGAEIEIVKRAFSFSGIKIKCVFVSYARLVEKFLSKKSLFATPVPRFEGDQVNAFYSNGFVTFTDVVASFNKEKVSLAKLEKSRIISYQKATLYLGDEFKKMSKKAISYKEIPGRDGQMKMLNYGRVDYIVGEKNILFALAKKLYPEKKLHINYIAKVWDLRAGSHDKELMERFNSGLNKMKKNGEIKKIHHKYKIVK